MLLNGHQVLETMISSLYVLTPLNFIQTSQVTQW